MSAARDILVIEDERMVKRAVTMVCEDEGLTLTAVENAAEGLRCMADGRFRLVLCDIMLPGIDGFGLLEKLGDRGDQTPVVMMTGYSTMENAVRSLAMGAVDYVPKPFTADELLTVIRRSLRCAALLQEAEAVGMGRDNSVSFVPCPADFYRLGYVSWVSMEDEGTARIGVSDLFLKAADGIREFDCSMPGEVLVQGVPCAVAISPGGAAHGIMCPMGGKVLEVNAEAQSNPSLVEKDPYFRGWLYRILPSNPESNMQWLSL
ncbi:MAG: response regulator [Xanthomonadales bacterium]|nr:response regulator [Xanthomonadales bacterium]NIX13152.1 response regulator [Xanthomonadales bacterium]